MLFASHSRPIRTIYLNSQKKKYRIDFSAPNFFFKLKERVVIVKKFFQLLVRPGACFKIEFTWKIGENTSLRIFYRDLWMTKKIKCLCNDRLGHNFKIHLVRGRWIKWQQHSNNIETRLYQNKKKAIEILLTFLILIMFSTISTLRVGYYTPRTLSHCSIFWRCLSSNSDWK